MRTIAPNLFLGVALWLVPQNAVAYNYDTHSKLVERAVEAMAKLTPAVPNPPPPPGVNAAEFNQYLTAVRAAPQLLKMLRTGLPNKLQGQGKSALPFDDPSDEPYPFKFEITFEPDPANPGHAIVVRTIPKACEFYPEDNLSDLSQFRIHEFRYLPQRTANPCGLEKQDVSNETTLGRVLGWHAGSIDDHVDDSVLWFRPTKVGAVGAAKSIIDKASTLGLAALIAPVACLIDLFSGGSCDPDDIYSLAGKYNPVTLIDGLIPGIGDVRSTTYTGLWHFINVAPDRGAGDFNGIPGMYYPNAGPDGEGPGAVDVAILAATDVVGMSLNAWEADGDDLYGDYDAVERFDPAWMYYTIGHTEFSPLDNLARHGWDHYLDGGGTSAEGLAWPLHALGDATSPHHVVGTTGWGHRPYEDAVAHQMAALLPQGGAAKDEQLDRLLIAGYPWWAMLQASGDIRAFIEELAFATHARASQGELVYDDAASTLYLVDQGGAEDQILEVAGVLDLMGDLLESSSAAMIGLLTYAAEHANDPGPGNISCPLGTAYQGDAGCVSATPVSGCQIGLPTCATDADCSPGHVCGTQCCYIQVD